MRPKRLARVAVAALVALPLLAGGAAGVCKLTPVDCGLGRQEQDIFRGRAGYGTGTTRLQEGFRQDVVVAGLRLPTSFAFLPDGRILVSEKDGLVRVVEHGRLLARAFLDIRDRVATPGYRGLLAVRPAPDFERSDLVYALYVERPAAGDETAPTTVRVSRFRARGNEATAASEEVVLGALGGRSCNDRPAGSDCVPCDGDHCGGDLRFAADGSLVVTTGDGWNGSAGFNANTLRAQDLDSLGGKMLRVTADGRGVASNPFWTGDPDANRSRVWAYGLRNPFRFTLHPEDELPFVGDVGWNEWEEIDVVREGSNLGWPCYEGRARPPEYVGRPACEQLYAGGRPVRFPALAYAKGSVTGGVFYDGDAFPARYRGAYFYGDWSYSWIRWARFRADGQPLRAPRADFATNAAGPVDLAVGPEGALYYLAANAGELRRITYAGASR